MNANNILNQLEALHYWDARVIQFNSKYFGEEIQVIFEDTDFNVELLFNGCSKLNFKTNPKDRVKPLNDLKKSQIPYFIQDIDIINIQMEKMHLLKCQLILPPLNIELICSTININKLKH